MFRFLHSNLLMKKHIKATFTFRVLAVAIVFLPHLAAGQSVSLNSAQQYHNNYQFDKAIAIYEKLLSSATDQAEKDSIFEKLLLSQNGQSMLQFAASPALIAKKTVPRKDFFLWYSHLADRSWTSDGNYYPEGASKYYISKDGDICETSRIDSVLWSAPTVVSREMVSAKSEIFPMLSPDGKELYISSDGLFGMGGYDLYVSRYDESAQQWGPLQNIGFPFSSVADDLLYTQSADGRYIVFASNRECDASSVVIYVVKYDNYLCRMIPQSEAMALSLMSQKVPDSGNWQFAKHSLRSAPQLTFEESEGQEDYTFKIGKEATLIESDIPDGIIYQIQIFASAYKAKNSALKGLSPVFVKKGSTGKYIYTVGAFRTYAEASAALPKVKRAGFPGAYMVAFDNGKSLSVSKARQKESQIRVVTEEVRIVR